MARTVKPLTNTEVEKTSPTDKTRKLSDGQGMFLLIRPHGSKAWLFNYTSPTTKQRRSITLGHYPAVTLAQARAMRAEYLSVLANGIDPQTYRANKQRQLENNAVNTFRKVALDWFEWRKGLARYSETLGKRIDAFFRLHLFDDLGDIPIRELKAITVINTITKVKDAGHLNTAKRLCRVVNEIMNYCLHRELIDANNLANIGKEFDTPEVTNFPTIKPEELPEFFKAFFNGNITDDARRTLLWQMLTMTRPSEAAAAKYSDIDEDAGIWAVIVKKGSQGTREHKVTLSTQARRLLERIKELNGGDVGCLFVGYKGKPRTGKNLNRSLVDIGYKGRLVAHGFRSIASTYLNEKAYAPDLIEVALSHLNADKIRAAYNRAEYIEQRREMLQDWGDYVERCIIEAGGSIEF